VKRRARYSRGAPDTPRLSLVALIDVVLFILLYFISSTSFTPDESQIGTGIRTESRAVGRTADLPPIILNVETAEGRVRYRLGERSLADRPSLTAVLRSLSKESGVVVRVSNDVPVAAAVAATQACKDAGFTKVSYVPVQ
jgi:biopolymer transport protein ExbD